MDEPANHKALKKRLSLAIGLLLVLVISIVGVYFYNTYPAPSEKDLKIACGSIITPFWAVPCTDAFKSAYRAVYYETWQKPRVVHGSLVVTDKYGKYSFLFRLDKNTYVCAYVNVLRPSDVNIEKNVGLRGC